MSQPVDDKRTGIIPTLGENVVSLTAVRNQDNDPIAAFAYELGKQAAMEDYRLLIRNHQCQTNLTR